ncbi:MAG: hypothetical protein WA700_08735 [Acidobacteriaceae bacterium]
MNPQPFSMISILDAHVGAYIGTVISMLFWASLTYWNYRQAKRKGTWCWSGIFLRVLLLMGAMAVFVCAFILPLAKLKTMESHPNLNIAITLAGLVAFVGVLNYFFAKYPLKPREQATPTAYTDSHSNINRALVFICGMFFAFGSMAQPVQQAQAAQTSQAGENSAAPAQSGSGMYRDPWGRYSLTVPDGWTAESQAKTGTLQLSSGPNWAMLLAGSGGEPRDVNHQIIQQIQAQFTGFQLLNEGELQINGHAAHGTTATGVNPKGERVSVLVLSISAGGGHFLTVISSSPNDQAKTVNATIMQIAQSIRFSAK